MNVSRHRVDDAVLCPDGAPLRTIRLAHPCGMTLTLIDWGAAWVSCQLPVAGAMRETLLGHARLADYLSQPGFFGATVGRFANRIANACFQREGQTFHLLPNEGKHQLHGGPAGFYARRWAVLEQSATHVLFGITSAAGDQGYPGHLTARVAYRLEANGGLCTEYFATVDAPCPVSLTNHAYFNLDGQASDGRAHHLRLAAPYYLPVDPEMIPRGTLAAVAGTSFDFRAGKRIATDFLQDEQQQRGKGYDHAFWLDPACHTMTLPAATLISGDGLLAMDLWTTLPALQFYSGNHLAGISARDGGVYQAYQGLALETGFLPDSPNHPEWPQSSCWLLPGETYHHRTRLVFRSAAMTL